MSRRLFLLSALIFIPFILRGESVVCIHGLVSTSKDMSSVRYSLALTGLEIHMWEYPSTKKFFHEHALSLCNALTRIAECHPGEPIHFVTHSSGGLVLRAALNMPQCPNEAKIGRAVLFAPPNQGSQLGRKWRYFFPLRIIIGCKSGLELQTYDPEVGMHLQVPQPDGSFVVFQILDINNSTVKLDANHPLAGKVLTFDLELLEISANV